jgi:hypothetical protein
MTPPGASRQSVQTVNDNAGERLPGGIGEAVVSPWRM